MGDRRFFLRFARSRSPPRGVILKQLMTGEVPPVAMIYGATPFFFHFSPFAQPSFNEPPISALLKPPPRAFGFKSAMLSHRLFKDWFRLS